MATAERMGYKVRQEWLGGSGGGGCEIAGRKAIFVDLALSPVDKLDQLLQAMRDDPAIFVVDLPDELRSVIGIRRAS